MEIITITPDELDQKIAAAVSRAIRPLVKAIQDNQPKEQPLPRSEIMREIQVKDLRTFKKRVREIGVSSCGKIGREPAYFLSAFKIAA